MTISEMEGVSTVDIYDSRWMNDTRGFHVVESEANLYATFKVAAMRHSGSLRSKLHCHRLVGNIANIQCCQFQFSISTF